MYIWRLAPVIAAEGGINRVVEKAIRARLSSLWIKIANGRSVFDNLKGGTADEFRKLLDRCHDNDIQVWGWHVPNAADKAAAGTEADIIAAILKNLPLDGLIMDAENGAQFFKGDAATAKEYGHKMRQVADHAGVPLAISSHDIPDNMTNWLPKFDAIAASADFNAPQVYYGASSSVLNRLGRAETANAHISLPFIPVGAAWIGVDDGGCSSASACAERAREFIRLVHERGYRGYSFWHWAGAPSAFWEVLNMVDA